MATKSKKSKGKSAEAQKKTQGAGNNLPPSPPAPNILLIGEDGDGNESMFVRAGDTGRIRKLSAEDRTAVQTALQHRRDAATELTLALSVRGFALSSAGTVDDPP